MWPIGFEIGSVLPQSRSAGVCVPIVGERPHSAPSPPRVAFALPVDLWRGRGLGCGGHADTFRPSPRPSPHSQVLPESRVVRGERGRSQRHRRLGSTHPLLAFQTPHWSNPCWKRTITGCASEFGCVEGAVAQRLEQATHNRLVAGSIPAGPTFPCPCGRGSAPAKRWHRH